MKDLTFFAKRRFFHVSDGHLMRGSSIIRADQIVEATGAKLNPTDGYDNDVCIYVKPSTKSLGDANHHLFTGGHPYLDVIDGYQWIEYLFHENPTLPVIACSLWDYETLTRKLKNKVVFIPQQNCNFERFRRDRKEVTTVGMIGCRLGNKYVPEDLEKRLNDVGLKLHVYGEFKKREDVVNFYKNIDIQLVWRPWKKHLSNPLKIVNASSFGIPTVALKENAFKELDGYYLPVETIEELIEQVQALKSSPELYADYSKRCIEKSEEYHISNVVKMYQKLCEQS
jgi:hypothetical protein